MIRTKQSASKLTGGRPPRKAREFAPTNVVVNNNGIIIILFNCEMLLIHSVSSLSSSLLTVNNRKADFLLLVGTDSAAQFHFQKNRAVLPATKEMLKRCFHVLERMFQYDFLRIRESQDVSDEL